MLNLKQDCRDFEFTVRTTNCLKNSNIRTIEELVKKTVDELAHTRNFGKKSLREVEEKLSEYGLHLGMSPNEIDAYTNIDSDIPIEDAIREIRKRINMIEWEFTKLNLMLDNKLRNINDDLREIFHKL